MTTRIVLDTSAVLAFFNGSESIKNTLNNAETVYLPSISVGELYFGACKCSRPAQERKKIDAIIAQTEKLSVDYATAEVYASIIYDLELAGNRIPLNDVWIAALAIQHDCTLLAKDAHFYRIEGLSILEV